MHELFDHVAVLHDGPEDLAAQLDPWMGAGLGADDAVLLSLDPVSAALVAEVVAGRAGHVAGLDAAARYVRPGTAMRQLHQFIVDALAGGATRVWAVGRIAFGDHDAWGRYEAAVDDVLGELPFVGVCAYDTRALAPASIDVAHRTHRHLRGPSGRARSPGDGRHAFHPASAWIPTDRPTVELPAAELAAARAAVGELAAASGFDAQRCSDMQLVTSELATNAVVHGDPPATVRVWQLPARIVVQARDHGPGLRDPWPDLRPPRTGSIGGYGLWLVGQLADRVDVARHDGTTCVTAGFDAEAADA